MHNPMSTNFKLNMVSPCSKNWEKMTATEKGRFCKSCNKEVINLIGLDNEELNKVVSQQSNNFCGRVEAKQLNSIAPVKRNWFNRVAAVLIGLGLTGLFTKSSNAQVIDASKMSNNSLQKLGIKDSGIDQCRGKYKIEGTVRDKKTGEGVPFAEVVCSSAGNRIGGAQSDFNGKFSFDITDSTGALIDLAISYIGYDKFEIKKIRLSNINLAVSLTLQECFIGLTTIVIEVPSRMVDPNNTSTGSTINRSDIQDIAH